MFWACGDRSAASIGRSPRPCLRNSSDAYESNTKAALEAGVFGVPTFAVGDELFWGQDRLDLLARALA
jgi:carboxymethylenebutenolidase